MELILIVLTSALLSACFLLAYKCGYEEGLKHVKDDSIKLNKKNLNMVKQYANFLQFTGEERK